MTMPKKATSKLLITLSVLGAIAVVLPRLAARSHTQVHRINQT
ncbi:hypothetical protein ACFQE5_09105 [Pseudonocardia hispaniensis]|uniref:Uncharacterized protein n=1 Tax=Pseudonocardia hispaniensis TaxID=904933 RepID=A0ABW1J0S4_9PSEU